VYNWHNYYTYVCKEEEMNRPIQFRTWNPKLKRFEYWGFGVDSVDATPYFKGPPSGGGFVSDQIAHNTTQFTGLLDLKGTEIYEGDITSQYRLSDYNCIREVRWYAEKCGFWLYIDNKPHLDLGTHREQLEVIGNIFENPDLLEAK
jgi:hypothetical protein